MIAPPVQPSKNRPDPTSKQFLTRLRSLPVFNATAVKLLTESTDPEVSLSSIEKLLNSDPALSSELLVAANSAAFGLRSHVATIRHALSLVGLDRLRSMVATVATVAYMRSLPSNWAKSIWAHGVATAVIAEHLARYSDNVSGSLMYTAGLVHDVGRLGLLSTEKQSYQNFLMKAYQDRAEADRIEAEQFGIGHTQAGEFLARLWCFPQSLCNHARNHHDPLDGGTEQDAIIQSACLLADSMGYPELRLETAGRSTVVERWQTKCLGDSCRGEVDVRVEEFFR